ESIFLKNGLSGARPSLLSSWRFSSAVKKKGPIKGPFERKKLESSNQRSDEEGNYAHHFDQDRDPRTRSIFERVSYHVTYNSGFVSIRTFLLTSKVTFLDVFLSVIPCTTSVCHEE